MQNCMYATRDKLLEVHWRRALPTSREVNGTTEKWDILGSLPCSAFRNRVNELLFVLRRRRRWVNQHVWAYSFGLKGKSPQWGRKWLRNRINGEQRLTLHWILCARGTNSFPVTYLFKSKINFPDDTVQELSYRCNGSRRAAGVKPKKWERWNWVTNVEMQQRNKSKL